MLALALALVAIAYAGAEVVMYTGAYTALPEGRFVRNRNDDNGHLSYRMVRLRERPPRGTVVYLLGGSATMESFTSEAALSAAVSRAAGQRVTAISLAGHAQSFAESLALVDNVPEGRGMVAVGLAPMRFTSSPEDDAGLLVGDPLFMRSEAVRRVLRQHSVGGVAMRVDTLAPGLARFCVDYVKERIRIRLPLLADIGYNEHYTISGPIFPRSQKLRWALRDVERDKRAYALWSDYNLDVLEVLVRRARQRGFRVVFFDQPLNGHVLGPSWGGVVPSYRRRALALAARLEVPYLDVAQRVRLDDCDFLDDYHLVVSGRLKWQPVFSAQIGAHIRAELRLSAPASRGPSRRRVAARGRPRRARRPRRRTAGSLRRPSACCAVGCSARARLSLPRP